MMKNTQKSIPLPDGRRNSVRLDDATWELIDRLAEAEGKNWREWCSDALAHVSPEENMTAALREAVSHAVLLSDAGLKARADDLGKIDANAFTRNSGMVSDGQFDEFLKDATVFGESDFGGFTIVFGQDPYGVDFLGVRNNLRDGIHFLTLADAETNQ